MIVFARMMAQPKREMRYLLCLFDLLRSLFVGVGFRQVFEGIFKIMPRWRIVEKKWSGPRIGERSSTSQKPLHSEAVLKWSGPRVGERSRKAGNFV